MSQGYAMLDSVAAASACERPMPDSSILPIQHGMLFDWQ